MEFLPETRTLIILLSFVGAFSAILVTAMPLVGRQLRKDRLKSVTLRREQLSREQRERLTQQQERRGRRRQARANVMKDLLERVNLKTLASSKELRTKLAMAGLRSEAAAVTFFYTRIGASLGGAVLAFLFMSASQKIDLPVAVELLIAVGIGAIGFYFPNLLVKNMAAKRQTAMTGGFPDALDLMVICVEGGLSVEGALVRVTDEILDSCPILAEEIGLMTVELSFLSNRRQAYVNFADRTGLEAAQLFTTAMIQSERYGTSVAVALKVLAQENRDSRMAKAEKKASALPAQLTVPMIVFFLPALFLVIMAPPILGILND